MEIIKKYITADGQTFFIEEEAKRYEDIINEVDKIMVFLNSEPTHERYSEHTLSVYSMVRDAFNSLIKHYFKIGVTDTYVVHYVLATTHLYAYRNWQRLQHTIRVENTVIEYTEREFWKVIQSKGGENGE